MNGSAMTTVEMTPSRATTTDPCGCGSPDCGCSDPVGLERTRFYSRMLVGPDELTQDQTWIRDTLRRHNRLLHGWGVVCGCDVTQQTDAQGEPVPWVVCVDQGYVLGPCGDEIVVDCPTTFDIRGSTGQLGPCSPPADPWCADVHVDRRPEQTIYVAIRYDEILTRPVRSLAGCGCGCDDAECEYSRIRESFALSALEALPDSYRDRPGLADLQSATRCGRERMRAVRPCPPCPTDPWVVLADVKADAAGLLSIDPIVNRRYVVAFGTYAFFCGPGGQGLQNVEMGMQRKEIARKDLAGHVDAKALRTLEQESDLSQADTLEATSLKGVSKRSSLGRLLGARSIGEVAGLQRKEFISEARDAGVDTDRAGEVWDAADHVARLVRDG
jgi:hypothetical protein